MIGHPFQEPLLKEIKVGKVQSHLIKKIEFLIQFATARTVHCLEGLSLDELVFDPINLKKHGLTCIALSRICTQKIYILCIA
jgi:hypothetical protein